MDAAHGYLDTDTDQWNSHVREHIDKWNTHVFEHTQYVCSNTCVFHLSVSARINKNWEINKIVEMKTQNL